jgi:hypothetical protein
MKTNAAWIALAAALAAGAAAAQAPERAPLESRLASLETLIERSSAARQVEASGVAEAAERRARARDSLRRAQEAQRGGDAASAERLLVQARSQMIEAVRLAAPEQITAAKARADFDARVESVKALLAAHGRISAEKGEAARGAETTRAVEQLLGAAAKLRAEGRIEAARGPLDQAYLIAKASVSSMRGGDTLVRSLSFASREEEYRYEVDRNDTHQMLIKVLVEGKGRAAAAEALLAEQLERARKLRAQAETAAGRGDHAAAIRLLEESTGELVKAIRSAGVYIPG